MARYLTLATTLAIGIQMILGGIVVGADAGFVCPDWPLCRGQVLPPLTGMVVLELVHRFTALLVSALVLANAIYFWRRHGSNRWLVSLSSLAVASLVVQVIVGGMIVLYVLPGVVTTIDVLNSMLLLGLYVALSAEVMRQHRTSGDGSTWPAANRSQLLMDSRVTLGFVGIAVLMGALFRHSGASEALFGINRYLASHGQHVPPSAAASTGLLVAHILTGVAVTFAALWLLFRSFQIRTCRTSAVVLMALVALQIGLGVTTLATRLDVVSATLHWSNAAALLAVSVWIAATAQLASRATAEQAARCAAAVLPNSGPVH